MFLRRTVGVLFAALLLLSLVSVPAMGVRAQDDATPTTTVVDENSTPEATDPAATEPAATEPAEATDDAAAASPTSTETPAEEPTQTATEAPTDTPVEGAAATETVVAAASVTGSASASASSSASASATATTAGCVLAPDHGGVGKTIEMDCTGFAPGETVQLFWNRSSSSLIRDSFVADSNGAGSGSFAVPASETGAYAVIAKGKTSGKKSIKNYTVEPRMTLSKHSGTVDTSVGITLTGFAASKKVNVVWFLRANSSTVITSVTTSKTGDATLSAIVPRTTAGSHTVQIALGSTGLTEDSFKVLPDLRLTPTNGQLGTTISAKLFGFGKGEVIKLTFAKSSSASTTVATVTASSTGTASASFTAPDASFGAHKVSATGNQSNTDTATFTLQERWVEVNLSSQFMKVWQGNTLVASTYVSTGRPGFDTPTGTFHILYKNPLHTMSGVINGVPYSVPDVPWAMYFTWVGHAIHGAYWHNNFGNTMSHGCINLPTYNTPGWSYDFAKWLYYWLPLGARVVIHY